MRWESESLNVRCLTVVRTLRLCTISPPNAQGALNSNTIFSQQKPNNVFPFHAYSAVMIIAPLCTVKRFVQGFKLCACLLQTPSFHTRRSTTSPIFATWKFSLTPSIENTGMISSTDWANFRTSKSWRFQLALGCRTPRHFPWSLLAPHWPTSPCLATQELLAGFLSHFFRLTIVQHLPAIWSISPSQWTLPMFHWPVASLNPWQQFLWKRLKPPSTSVSQLPSPTRSCPVSTPKDSVIVTIALSDWIYDPIDNIFQRLWYQDIRMYNLFRKNVRTSYWNLGHRYFRDRRC